MDIAKNIRKRRLELGLTLKQVADALGVAESTVLRYETNEIQHMGIDKIEALAKVLRISPAALLGWTTTTRFYQFDIDLLNSAFEKYGLFIDLVNADDPDWAVFYWNNYEYEFTRIPLEDLWSLYVNLNSYSNDNIAHELRSLYNKYKIEKITVPSYVNRTLSAMQYLNEEGQKIVANQADLVKASGKYDREKIVVEEAKPERTYKVAAYDGQPLTDDEAEEVREAAKKFWKKQEENNK